MMQLSKRLRAVADLAGEAGILADVGTDHGYIPLFLVASGRAGKAIAMDVNEGPLMRAREHILQWGLGDRIETRLSDGLEALDPGEAQVIVIAGMGGALMTRILAEGEAAARAARRLVLQPQSELYAFRCFLAEHGYRITAEDMVYEDGKYYSMMAAEWRPQDTDSFRYKEAELKYGPLLLAGKHPVLQRYLSYQKTQKQKIMDNIGNHARQDVSGRRAQVAAELAEIEQLLEAFSG